MFKKTIKYENKSGMSLCFGYTKPYFLEKIDATSLNGSFTANAFARSPGQITVYKNVGARSVVCEFAVWITNEKHKTEMLDYIVGLFNPLESGVLTITNDCASYDIDCYPSAVPLIRKDSSVGTVYRFNVDFICDYPYFRQQGEITVKITQPYSEIYSRSVVNVPLKIHFLSGTVFKNQSTNQGFTIGGTDTGVTVDTKEFTVTDDNGNDVSNLISAADDIGDIYLKHGQNSIFCSAGKFPVTVTYHNLFTGVT